VSTQGTVIDLEERSSSSGSRRPTYGAIVKFKSRDGEPHVFASSYSSNPPPHEIGETVTVHYDPQNPRSAIVYSSFWSLWFYPLIPLFLGPIFVALGIVFLKLSPRF
jgi:hypothetical protein